MPETKLSLAKLKVVLFDWDNTLAESRTPLVYAVNKVLEEYGLPDWNVVKQRRDNNLSFRDNFPRIFGNKAGEAYDKYSKIYLKNVARLISTFEGVSDVLKFLRKKQIKIIIMTNKDRRLLDFELPLLFETEMFDRIVAGHEAPRDKPYGEHALYALQGIIAPEEINPDTVWVVGDSPQDSSCAMAVQARPIRIGKPIWGDDGDKCPDIVYFDTFCDFYKALIS